MRETTTIVKCDICEEKIKGEPEELGSTVELCEDCYDEYPEWFKSHSRGIPKRGFPTPEEVKNNIWLVYYGEACEVSKVESVEEAKKRVKEGYLEMLMSGSADYFAGIFDGEEKLPYTVETEVKVVKKD